MEHIPVSIRGKQPGIRLPSSLNSCVPTAAVCFMSHCTRLPYGTDPTRRHTADLIGINWTHLSVQLPRSKKEYTFLNRKWIMGKVWARFPLQWWIFAAVAAANGWGSTLSNEVYLASFFWVALVLNRFLVTVKHEVGCRYDLGLWRVHSDHRGKWWLVF